MQVRIDMIKNEIWNVALIFIFLLFGFIEFLIWIVKYNRGLQHNLLDFAMSAQTESGRYKTSELPILILNLYTVCGQKIADTELTLNF